MNLKTGFIVTCIVTFSPAVLAQQEMLNGFIHDTNEILIAENRSGTSNEKRDSHFQPTMLEDNDMMDANETMDMEQGSKNMVDDSNTHSRERINHKRS